jgi:hypothetical protein
MSGCKESSNVTACWLKVQRVCIEQQIAVRAQASYSGADEVKTHNLQVGTCHKPIVT